MNRGVSIPLRNTQFDRIRGVSCAVNSPRRRAYPKIGTFPQSLHKRNPLLCAGADSWAARSENPTCSSGQRYLPKRGRFILVGFICGNVALQRWSALICHREIGGAFGSMRQILDLPSTPGFCDNKPAGRALEHMRCGRPIEILPHTFEIQANIAQNNRPYNAK